MSKKRELLFPFAALGVALLCAPSGVRAAGPPMNINLPFSGNVNVGMWNNMPVARVCQNGTLKNTWVLLGDSNGLTGDYAIHGASGNDNMGIVSSTITDNCGFTIKPLKFNGHEIWLYGEGGNDMVGGGSVTDPDNIVSGGPGNDIIWSAPGGTAEGNAGSDWLIGWGISNSTACMYGGREDSSNDFVCEATNSTWIWEMDGGPGTGDVHCGWGMNLTTGFESNDCSKC